MKKLVFGSLNIDKVYGLPSIVRPGETTSAITCREFCGGKGFNQAIALARAGSQVSFAGAIGSDGDLLTEKLTEAGIDDALVIRLNDVSGHAIIQVEDSGQNAIIVYPGANGKITLEDIDRTLAKMSRGDLIVLQNEIAYVDVIIARARALGMVVAFNPSPITCDLYSYPIDKVDYLILNEIEAALLSETENINCVLNSLAQKYPNTSFVLTLGSQGAVYLGRDGQTAACGVMDVSVVDTTAAGDTFCGYFLHQITEDASPQQALLVASAASNIVVTRAGAEHSIPMAKEVEQFCEMTHFLPPPDIFLLH